ncbi:MAG: ATP-binding protein [Candidatus Gastranaerophilales bacterium]|nr:ATP-binding protein [Candidatus Gastranaerophilales bacterium]
MILKLAEDESSILEYKEEVNDGFFKSLSAFANTDGGTIILGISNEKNIKGIDLSNGNQETIINKIIHSLGIQPKIQVTKHKNKNILSISVEKSSNPISFKSIYYKRIGNTTRVMTTNELRTKLLSGVSWESQTGNYSIDDIKEETVKEFVRLGINEGRLPEILAGESIELILKRLELIINGKLTNAAILLFGKNPQKYFMNANIRVGGFKGNDEVIIVNDKTINGNLFEQVINAEEAIKFCINVRYVITGKKLDRDDIWDYPLNALREALLNSIIHRDYFDNDTQIQIKIFKDWLWFYNPGKLVDDLTIEQLKTSHPSKPRNRLIASVFYRSGKIEKFGSGILRITEACKKQALPEPDFIEEFGGFSVKFSKFFKGLNKRQTIAIGYIQEYGSINNSKYQEITNTTRETSKRDLAKMLKIGIVQKEGEGKFTKYVLSSMTHNDP